MKYTVITYVPKSDQIPKPGEILVVPIFEAGCKLCVMGHDGKLKVCWKHTHDRILWGRTEEMENEIEKVGELTDRGHPLSPIT